MGYYAELDIKTGDAVLPGQQVQQRTWRRLKPSRSAFVELIRFGGQSELRGHPQRFSQVGS